MTRSYSDLLKDPRWQKKRLETFERDEWKCTECGDDEENLQVHHLQYTYGHMPWEYESCDLVTLCEQCHYIHTKLNKAQKSMFCRLPAEIKGRVIGYMGSLAGCDEPDQCVTFDAKYYTLGWHDGEKVKGIRLEWDGPTGEGTGRGLISSPPGCCLKIPNKG